MRYPGSLLWPPIHDGAHASHLMAAYLTTDNTARCFLPLQMLYNWHTLHLSSIDTNPFQHEQYYIK